MHNWDFRGDKKAVALVTAFLLCIVVMAITTVRINVQNSQLEKQIENGQTESIFEQFEESDRQTIIRNIQEDKVSNAIRFGNTMYLETVDKKQFKCTLDSELESYATLRGIEIKSVASLGTTPASKEKQSVWGNPIMIFCLIVAIVTAALYYNRMSTVRVEQTTSGQGNTDTKRAEKGNIEVPNIHFSDVQGVDELKSDVLRIVDFLKDRDKYTSMGARTPKGIILYGPPGTGKTLLAKAIAGEAGVPFFSMSGSDFVEMYVGVGAKRVRELYQKAKKAAPSIVFIDEVDAIAHKRGRDNNSEDDKTINALLTELDGFEGNSGVITICATNRLDMLDNAFQRAGRFDLKLAVGLPDKKARLEILKIHGRNKRFSDEVSLKEWGEKTPSFSGAELEALLNESALLAAAREHQSINNSDLEDAFYKILLKGNKCGPSEMSETKRITAWHEAGHTIATKLLTNDSVPTVTIIGSTSGAGGITFRVPQENGMYTKKYLRNLIKVMLAGRAAEELYTGNEDDITTGASEDIKQATSIAKQYIESYGMGSVGLIDITQFDNGSAHTFKETYELNRDLYIEIKNMLTDNLEKLNKLAVSLLENETLNESEINRILY